MSKLIKFLFCLAFAAVAVGAAGAGYFVQKAYYARMQDRLLNDFFMPAQKTAAQYIASKLEDRINGITGILKTVADLPEFQKIAGVCTKEQVAALERATVALKENIDHVSLIDKAGTVVCASNLPQMIGISVANYPHIKEVMATHQAVISRAFTNPLGTKLISVNVPVFDQKREFAGILGGAIRLESFKDELNAVSGATPSAYNALDDDDGMILVHPRAEFEMKNALGEEMQEAINFDSDLNNAYRKMFAGETGYSFYTLEGERKVIGYAPAKIINGDRFFVVAVTAKMAEYGYVGEEYLMKSLFANFGVIFAAAMLMLTIFYFYGRRERADGELK